MFLEIAQVYRELEEAIRQVQGRPDKEAASRIRTQAVEKLVEIAKRHRDLPEGVDSIYSLITVTGPTVRFEEAVKQPPSAHFRAFLGWLAWKRFRRPLWQLIQEDAAGNRKASKMVERIFIEGNKLRYGEKLPGFKHDLDHTGLLEMGLPLGLDKLTAEELADCFDEVCSCGQEHTGDALKKQRKRLIKAIEAARSWQRESGQPLQRKPTEKA